MFRFMSKKDRRIKNLEAMVKNRDEKLQEMLNINEEHKKINGELMTRINDLENNIELLINNLSAQKKKQLGL